MKFSLSSKPWNLALPGAFVVLFAFLVHTFIYPLVIYKLYYPEIVKAESVVDFNFIESHTNHGGGVIIEDDTEVIDVDLGEKSLIIEKNLSGFAFSGKVMRLVDQEGNRLTGFTYESMPSKQGRNTIRFVRGDDILEFKFYDDSYIIRSIGAHIGTIQVADTFINTSDAHIAIGGIQDSTGSEKAVQSGSIQFSQKIFSPVYKIDGIYIDGKSKQIHTSRDVEIARIFKEIQEKESISTEKKYVPKSPKPKYSFDLVDGYYELGAIGISIPDGEKQEIKFTHGFSRSIGSDTYISADTFQGDPTAVDEILRMGGLEFVKQNSVFYDDKAKIGYLDTEMKKFVELKLKSEPVTYIGKRGSSVIYQGKEDTYIYALHPDQTEKIKETVIIKEARATNSYTYEVIGNYRLQKNDDNSVTLLGQNLNKAGLTETCSDEYYDTEKAKREEDIKNMDEKSLLQKYGKEKVGDIDTTEFCVSPRILKEKKKEIPYDVPVFRVDRPVTFGTDQSEVDLDVNVSLSGSEITYSFDTTHLAKSLFPIRFDPTLTTDAELRNADISSFTVNGGIGLGTQPTGGPLGTWTGTTNITAAKHGMRGGAYNGYIYVIGGYNGSSVVSSAEYAPINANGTLGTWTATTSMTNARSMPGVVIYNGYIYAIGGWNGTTRFSSTEYAPINANGTLGTWTATTSMTTVRYALGVAVYNGYIYAIGGQNNTPAYLSTTEYTPINANGTLGTWTATTSMGTTRYSHGVSVYNGYIYAIGGYNGSYLATTEYTPINANGTLGTWTATMSMTTARMGHGVVIHNGYIYALGGASATTTYLSSTEYTPINSNGTLGAWTATTSMTTVRVYVGLITYNGYIYAVGGSLTGTSSYLSTTEYARIQGVGGLGNWTASTSMTRTRGYFGASGYNGYIYAVGGGDGTSSAIATTEYAAINANGTLGTWTATTSMTTARQRHCVVTYNGYIYALGGHTGSAFLATTEYAPINANGTLGTWTATTSMTTARIDYGVVAYNGYIYALGGVNSSPTPRATTEYAAINANGTLGTWTATTSMTNARFGHGVAVYNGYIYAVEGGGAFDFSTEYAPINTNGTLGTWAATTSMIVPRYQHNVVTYNGYIYAIGGMDFNLTTISSTEYAPINSNGTLGAWTDTVNMTVKRRNYGTLCYNGYIYAIGGMTTGGVTLSSTEYAPIANTAGSLGVWTASTSMTSGRYGHGTVAYNGYMYAIGGSNGTTVLNTTEYAPINANGTLGTWTATTSMGTVRWTHTVVAYNGYIYAIGGATNTAGTTAVATTEYAPINANGTLGTWTATTSMGTVRWSFAGVTYNGYIYAIGGHNLTTYLASTEYAPINSNGTLGTWTTTTNLLVAKRAHAVSAYNGYIYAIGGYIGSWIASTEYAPINSNGTLGTWTTTTSMINARSSPAVVAYNGYIYVYGGQKSPTFYSSSIYAPINSNGTLGTWTESSKMASSRDFPGSGVAYNGYIYALGGYNGSAYVATTEYASISGVAGLLSAWTATTSMTIARSGHGVSIYNGYIYAIGGGNAAGTTYLSTTEYAAINANGTLGTWTATTSMISPRWSVSVSIYNGYIYAVGGANGGGALSSTEYAPINANGTLGTWTATTSMTIARGTKTSIYNGYIYAIGGGALSSTEYAPINANGTLGTWTATTSMTIARSGHGVSIYNGYIYVTGGRDAGSVYLSSTEYAPINSNGTLGTWTRTSSMNRVVWAHRSECYNGYIYAVGGTIGSSSFFSTEYAPINANGTLGTWTATTSMTTGRSAHGIGIYNGYIYVVGGQDVGVELQTTQYARINHTPQSSIQQLWHKTYDKGSSSSTTTYVSIKYNTQIDSDTYVRYRLWDNAGTTVVYRSQWIPLESYKTSLSEWKVVIPSYGLSYRYLDFEIMRASSQDKVSNNTISIGYGINSCLVCTGTDVVISNACVLTVNTTCTLNNIEITSAGTLEVQSPAILNFDFAGHRILIRNGGKFLIRNGAMAY